MTSVFVVGGMIASRLTRMVGYAVSGWGGHVAMRRAAVFVLAVCVVHCRSVTRGPDTLARSDCVVSYSHQVLLRRALHFGATCR